MDYKERHAIASRVYRDGLTRVKSTPEPVGQKFPIGSRVRIKSSRKLATVEYTYAHAFPDFGDDCKSYSLFIDGIGSFAWVDESDLEFIEDGKHHGNAKT